MQTTLNHIQINVRSENLSFYADLFEQLGWQTLYADGSMLGIGDTNRSSVWFIGRIKDVINDYDGPGMNHLAIGTATQADVNVMAAYLTGRGVSLLFDTPRHRPEFAAAPDQTYYQIMFESPDRILFEVVYTGVRDN
ncbi:MAG: hypothetical protein M9928_08820 [Anaerolineae bacterium]|nr:hypothetical protein [Anaerolineae bacterium]MCO5196796.1 hypothetical protein [Anaerolineae bacterium]MCO5205120.1 hypothetical protein [Anaerolineae bacterium]